MGLARAIATINTAGLENATDGRRHPLSCGTRLLCGQMYSPKTGLAAGRYNDAVRPSGPHAIIGVESMGTHKGIAMMWKDGTFPGVFDPFGDRA